MHVLVLYYHVRPIPSPERDRLYSYGRYSAARVAHHNLARGALPSGVLEALWDVVVFDESLFALRFEQREFRAALGHLRSFPLLETTRVALIADPASETALLAESLERLAVACVVSTLPSAVAKTLFAGLVGAGVRFLQRKGAYLDERTVNRLESPSSNLARPYDLGLAPEAPRAWLGRLGVREVAAADATERLATRAGVLRVERRLARSDLAGDAWWRFLLKTRYFVSAEAGFDHVDVGGSLRRRTLTQAAPVEPIGDEALALSAAALRPSHLEACAARTCLILVAGDYEGVLEPKRHYLELEADLSNLDEVLEAVLSDVERKSITDRAYEELVGSNANSLRHFADLVLNESGAAEASGRGGTGSPPSASLLFELRARDAWSWRRVAAGESLASAPADLRRGARTAGRVLGRAFGAITKLRRGKPKTKGLREPRRVVTLTPLPVEKDSRTYKQAASVSRFGYESQLFEGARSSLPQESLPFELGLLRSSGAATLTKPLLPRGLYQVLHASHAPKRLLKQVIAIYRAYADQYVWPALESLPEADLYYMHSPYFFPAVYWKCRQNGARYVYDAHDFYGRIHNRSAQTPTLRYFVLPFFDLLERCSVKFAAEAVTVSEGVAQLQEEAFERPFTLLRNVQDPRLETEPAQNIRERLGLSEEDFLLVVVGNAKEGQAVKETLQALRELPDHVHVAFLGGGHEPRAALVREYGLEHRVHLCGPVKPFEVVPHIRAANAGLVIYFALSPNYLHCLPNGFFQCVSAGLPVLYPRLPEMERLGERFRFGIAITPQDPASIAEAIRELLTEPEAYAELRQNAQAAAQHLSWEREEAVLRQLLDEALP